ncbi:MAG: CocE/NonD family hydrolase [Myxococcales bacterium]|nr:CocE/NonD family hydrolase [Myxococcales bacterium]MCB9751896.1 CocE/NonD family hydrolase [Myxococcales bacterium]
MSSSSFPTSPQLARAGASLLLALALPACGYDLYSDSLTTETDAGSETGTSAGTSDTTGGETSDGTGVDTTTTEGDTEGAVVASFDVRESVEQLHVWNATPGIELEVHDDSGSVVAAGTVDQYGGLVFRELAPGSGYSVQTVDGSDRAWPLEVMPIVGSTPPQSFYDAQEIGPGFSYITTRDGTTLSVYVTLPGPIEDGPYPTLVNYSGYSPSKPGEPIDASALPDPFDLESLCKDLPILCDNPNHPSGTIGGLMGFATVGVNMRGTGCSGGAYDYFEPLQALDGYDIVETIAAQPWVKFNKVGLAGLSYPGISQLYVARENPPSLAAISPLSVIADISTSTLAPGGIFNDGFALNWADNVVNNADPYGQGWEQTRVDGGDSICAENQKLHGQKVDVVAKALANPFYTPEFDLLNPLTFVDQIDVPIFTAGAWQDEQTGGHFPALWNQFTSAPIVRYNGYNGVHADGYTPDILIEWNHFLSFYVRKEIPQVPDLVRTLAPLLFEEFFGDKIQIPPDRFLDFDSYESALAAYEAEKPVRILFEAGGAPGEGPGLPIKSFEYSFDQWPLPEITPQRWHMQPWGILAAEPPPADGGGSQWTHDPDAGQVTTLPSGDINSSLPPWNWPNEQDGRAVVFQTAPLQQDVVMIGPASADLWIRSTADEADLEVTITEVRPDNQEMYIQSGWLRASHRKIDDSRSTELRPVQTHLEEDAEPLTPGEWTFLRVEIFPFAHAFRAGSSLRVAIDDPGGTRAEWAFILHDFGGEEVKHAIGHDSEHASSIVFPVVPGIDVPTDLPACPSLRGQPCRTYKTYLNESAD